MSSIQPVCGTNQAHLHEVVDGLGSGQLPDDVARRGGVDDDHVVMAFPHLVSQLADGEDLLDARRGRGDEIEHAGHRSQAGHHRDAKEQLQILVQ